MEAISGWFAGKAAEKELNSVGESFANMVEDTSRTMTNLWDSMLGKTQKPLWEFLKAFDLPPGILPKNNTRFEFAAAEGTEGQGKLKVHMPFAMDVKFSDGTVLQFAKTVTAELKKGKLDNLVGVRLSGMMWTDVTGVSVEGDKVVLKARMKKTKPASLFKTPLEGVEVRDIK